MKVQFDVTKVIRERQQDALDRVRITVEDLVEALARVTTSNIRAYAGAYGIENARSREFVRMIRALGGYSEMVRITVGREPDPKRDEFGIPTDCDWWIWKMRMDLIEHVCKRVRTKILKEGLSY